MQIKKQQQFFLTITFSFFVCILFFYLRNLTHDVYAGDIGDLATAAALFGIPHPPGYPTFTFLGFLISKLPVPLPVVSRVALVSVFASLAGLLIFFRFCLDVTAEKKRIGDGEPGRLGVAILSTAILGFSYYYWLYAEVPEVFALNNLFVIAVYYSAFKFYKSMQLKYLYLTSFIVGLSMTNQQAIMFTFPGLFVLVLPDIFSKILQRKKGKLSVRIKELSRIFAIIKKTILFFLLGLLPYIYVIIAALTNPQINWMKEPTLYNFIRLILRMDYTFAENLVDITQRIILLGIYFTTLINTYSLVLCIILLVGFIVVFYRDKRLFSALLTGFLFSGPLFIFIITPEIIDPDEMGIVERMFVQSFVLAVFYLPFGFNALQQIFYKIIPRKVYGLVFLLPFFIVVGQMIYFNLPKTDLSETKIGTDYAYDILGPLPKNSLVFLVGDNGTLNSWYVHYVEGYRPDLVFMGSFGDRNDFENELVAEYKKKNKKIKLKSETIVVKMLPEVLKERKIFSMYQFPLGRKDYLWVPRGLVFELMPVSQIPTKAEYFKQVGMIIKQYNIAYRDNLKPSEQNNIAPYISKMYSNAFNYIGDFLYIRYNDKPSAFGYYLTAQMIDPYNPLTFAKMGIVQAEMPGHCKYAVDNIDTAINMYKIYRPYYTFALRIYNKCDISDQKVKELKVAYKKMFGKDLEKDPHY